MNDFAPYRDNWGRQEKEYSDHKNDPPISVYILSSNGPKMEKYSCGHCKRTIFDFKGMIGDIITTPMPITEYDVAINIRCKLCHANYRLLVNSK